MRCLWCKTTTGASEPEEHIIPDSLGCPEDLVFRNGEVCAQCNNENSRLDLALVSDFEFCRFMARVPNKRGKPPTIATRANAKGRYENGEPYLAVNMDRRTPAVDRTGRLAPFRDREEDIQLVYGAHTTWGVEFSIRQTGICNSKRWVRALHKIALSIVAKQFGQEAALSERFDAVRQFVLDGRGDRTVLLSPAAQHFEYVNQAALNDGSVFPIDVVGFRLVVIGFMADLSPSQEHLQTLKSVHRALLGESWTWAPT